MKGWHFLADDRRLGYGDGRLVKVGETLSVGGVPELCEHGLHASKRLIDALQYAQGNVICRVEVSGDVDIGDDKFCGRHRTVLAMLDGTELLRAFARKCALDVVHLWDAPKIVVRYLRTGDPSIRAAAEAAALGATWGAARDAAEDAARAAAQYAAEYAARAAAWGAAEDAVWGAVWEAAWAAAWAAQNRRLTAMVARATR